MYSLALSVIVHNSKWKPFQVLLLSSVRHHCLFHPRVIYMAFNYHLIQDVTSR